MPKLAGQLRIILETIFWADLLTVQKKTHNEHNYNQTKQHARQLLTYAETKPNEH